MARHARTTGDSWLVAGQVAGWHLVVATFLIFSIWQKAAADAGAGSQQVGTCHRSRPSDTSMIRRARSKEGLSYLRNKWWTLKFACIEDETMVLWDPKVVRGDLGFSNLPDIDLSFMRYSMMRASFSQVVNVRTKGVAEPAVAGGGGVSSFGVGTVNWCSAWRHATLADTMILGNCTQTICMSAGKKAVHHMASEENTTSTEHDFVDLHGGSNTSSNSCLPPARDAKEEEFRKRIQKRELEFSTSHYDLKYHLPIRYASRQEAIVEEPLYFSKCTVPILIYTDWPHNYAEYVIRVPALLAAAQHQGLLDRGMTPVLALPNKLKADGFNMDMLRPFFDYEPVTFRDFSRPSPPETLSNHTAEGKPVKCFRNLIIARLQFGEYPLAVTVAMNISDWFHKHRPLAAQDSPWKEPKPEDVVRILIEKRPYNGTRQFWGLEQVLEDCGKSPPVVGPAGRLLRLQCIAHVFGSSEFARDMGVLRDTDIIVAFHGAGAINTIFMPPHSSLIEVRPYEFGTKEMAWPNMWLPQIARQSGWKIFFWGVNVEDPDLCPVSPAEAAGFAMKEVVRDRSIKLRWEWLRPAVEAIAQVNRSVTAYVQHLRNLSFLWQVEPGGKFGFAPANITNATLIP